MEPIVSIPDDTDVDPEGDLRLVRVEYAKGGEDIESVTVYDRETWLDEFGGDEAWRTIAQQEFDSYEVHGQDGRRLVRVELPGWWVQSEAEDADPHDMTWQQAYGKVYGKESTLAVVDHNWSADRAAWSFPYVKHKDRGWHQPGKYGPGGPKSLIPVTFPVGKVRPVDTVEVSAREAREAAPKAKNAPDYDWSAAIEKAEERAEARAAAQDSELDLSAITTLEDQGQAVKVAGNKALVKFNDEYQDAHGVEPDPVTLTAASEAIAQAVRQAKNIDDPRDAD